MEARPVATMDESGLLAIENASGPWLTQDRCVAAVHACGGVSAAPAAEGYVATRFMRAIAVDAGVSPTAVRNYFLGRYSRPKTLPKIESALVKAGRQDLVGSWGRARAEDEAYRARRATERAARRVAEEDQATDAIAVSSEFPRSCDFVLALLKGLVEHGDGTVYFQWLDGYATHENNAIKRGYVHLGPKRIDRRHVIRTTQLTDAGRAAYVELGLDRLPKSGRAYAWDWGVLDAKRESP